MSQAKIITHIQRECIALQEQFQIRILRQYRMICDLDNTLLEGSSPLLDKLPVETTKRALFRYRRDENAWVVLSKRLVQPEEV